MLPMPRETKLSRSLPIAMEMIPASTRRPSAAPPACGVDTRAAVMLVHPLRDVAESVANADTARQSGRDVL